MPLRISSGLGDQRVEIAMMRTPDGHGRLELSRFLEPSVVADHRTAPVNALGYLRVMFAVDAIAATLERLGEHGTELVSDEVVRYQDAYRLCYVGGLKADRQGPVRLSADPEALPGRTDGAFHPHEHRPGTVSSSAASPPRKLPAADRAASASTTAKPSERPFPPHAPLPLSHIPGDARLGERQCSAHGARHTVLGTVALGSVSPDPPGPE